MEKYYYTIFPDNSPEKFRKFCNAIENYFSDLHKNKLLIDVDGSTIQTYTLDGKTIEVYDDYEVGAVFAISDFDLSEVLNKFQ